jgi:3-methyladenine DNA glycosylase Mpg
MKIFMVKQKLEELLSTKKIEENASEAFNEAAKFLMKDCLLQIRGEKFRIIELEFYYCSRDHRDCYIHDYEKGGHAKQKQFGRWYVHASGLDLTFGSDGNAGGILLRGIKKIDNDGNPSKTIYSGPINLRQPVLRDNERNVMSSFKVLDELDALDNTIVSIVKKNRPFDGDVICFSRVGLKEKASDTDASMLNRHYRYIAEYKYDSTCIHPFREKEMVAKHLLNIGKIEDLKDVLGYNLSHK